MVPGVLRQVGDHGLIGALVARSGVEDLEHPRAYALSLPRRLDVAEPPGAPGRQSLVAGIGGPSATGHNEADDGLGGQEIGDVPEGTCDLGRAEAARDASHD